MRGDPCSTRTCGGMRMTQVPVLLHTYARGTITYVHLAHTLMLPLSLSVPLSLPLSVCASLHPTPLQAVESLAKLCGQLRDEHVRTAFVALIQRMVTGEFFTSRTSACGLFACAYPRLGPDQQDTLRQYVPVQLRLLCLCVSLCLSVSLAH
jgi:hypothetical protein